MKVQIKRNTNSAFGYLRVGDELDVDSQIAKRWAKYGIATIKEVSYEDMDFKELRAIAKEKEIDNYYKMSKEDLLSALEGVKHEQN